MRPVQRQICSARSRPALLIGLWLLAGLACYPRQDVTVPATGDSGTGTGTGTDGGGTGLISVSSVTPTDGPATGGSTVTLQGGPFTDQAQVTFGDAAATVQSVADGSLTVLSPSVAQPGLVGLRVDQDGDSANLPDAFRYWTDVGGQTVLIGTWLQLALANPKTWTGNAPTFDAWVRFVQPGDVAPSDRYGIALDTCAEPSDPLSSLLGPEEIMMGFSDFKLALTWSKSRQEYAYQAASHPDPREDEAILLQTTRSDLSPPLDMSQAVRTPQQLDLLTPDLAAASVPELAYQAATVTWKPGGYGRVLIAVGTSDTARFLCLASDDGKLTIPSARFDDFSWTTTGAGRRTDAWLAVAGVASTQTPLDWNNGAARVDAALGLLGRVRVVDNDTTTDTGTVTPDTGVVTPDTGVVTSGFASSADARGSL